MKKVVLSLIFIILAVMVFVPVLSGCDDSPIVIESAADFFSGLSSVQDVARVIQNRASIYIAEQG